MFCSQTFSHHLSQSQLVFFRETENAFKRILLFTDFYFCFSRELSIQIFRKVPIVTEVYLQLLFISRAIVVLFFLGHTQSFVNMKTIGLVGSIKVFWWVSINFIDKNSEIFQKHFFIMFPFKRVFICLFVVETKKVFFTYIKLFRRMISITNDKVVLFFSLPYF